MSCFYSCWWWIRAKRYWAAHCVEHCTSVNIPSRGFVQQCVRAQFSYLLHVYSIFSSIIWWQCVIFAFIKPVTWYRKIYTVYSIVYARIARIICPISAVSFYLLCFRVVFMISHRFWNLWVISMVSNCVHEFYVDISVKTPHPPRSAVWNRTLLRIKILFWQPISSFTYLIYS